MVTRLIVLVLLDLLVQASVARAEPVAGVAVLGFENRTGDASCDGLRAGLTDMLVTDLGTIDGLSVESERASYTVSAAIVAASPLRLEARLVGADKVVTVEARGPADGVFAIEQRLVVALAQALEVRYVPRLVATTKVKDLSVLRDYGAALELVAQADAAGIELDGRSNALALRALDAVLTKAPAFVPARQRRMELAARMALLAEPPEPRASDAEFEDVEVSDPEPRRALLRRLRAELDDQPRAAPLPGHDAAALALARAWSDGAFAPGHDTLSGEQSLAHARFVLLGEAEVDGRPLRMAPPVAERVPLERQLGELMVLRAVTLGRAFSASHQQRASEVGYRAAELEADYRALRGDYEGAIAALQAFLDERPGEYAAPLEDHIARLLGLAPDAGMQDLERWHHGLALCREAELSAALDTVLEQRFWRLGLRGYTAVAREASACGHLAPAFWQDLYAHSALALARHGACRDLATALGHYRAHGGDAETAAGYRARAPGCRL